MKAKIFYVRVTSPFLELFLCVLFLKNNQLKIILMLKRHISGWQVLLPFK